MEKNVETTDLVSVIVPFLNGSDWLREALESVLAQTYPHWEIILIDDGSDACHSEVAKEFCRHQTCRIVYTEHENHLNKGVSMSRNEAVKLARGKYLAFLDADDVWLPGKLSNQLWVFSRYPEVAAVCNAMISWYSWQDKNRNDIPVPVGATPDVCYPPNSLNKILYPFRDAAPPAPSGIMITHEAFERLNGFEPLFSGIYELYEDQAFLSKLYLHESVYISGRADLMYRKRENSMSSAANDLERYDTVRAFYFDWLENYLKNQNRYDDEMNRLIKQARKQLMPATQFA